MKNTMYKPTKLVYALAVGILICQAQLSRAGWTGVMNSGGNGQASVNVRAYETSLLKTKTITTPSMFSPSASMAPTDGYAVNADLPEDASPATVAKVKGSPGYIWQALTVGSDGDSTDNTELESRVTITAADCASLEMTSSAVITPETKSGMISVKTVGTAGTAIWLRGFELLEGQVPPEDDPETEVNEFIEFLKAYGSVKWDVLYVGPFALNDDCTKVNIPFTYETDTTNLYFVTDGVAKSLPLVIECPDDISVTCGQPVTYPETVLVGGCGNITVAFDPPYPTGGSYPAGYFPLGETPVTVTATDQDGNSKSCTFKVKVTDANFHGFYAPIGGEGGSCGSPLRTAKLGNNLPVKFDVECAGSEVTTGQPTLSIEKASDDCSSLTPIGGGNFTLVGNEWHFNWETGSGGVTVGGYKLTATLQDGTEHFVWIRLK